MGRRGHCDEETMTTNLQRSVCLVFCLLAAGCGGGADEAPVNTQADPGALIACREFLQLAERQDKDLLTKEQLREGIGKVREHALAANPASEVARLSEQLLKIASGDDSKGDRSETFQQLKDACGQAVK
jgi:hypothetical protein